MTDNKNINETNTISCRDRLLAEYKGNFDLNSKFSTYDDGGKFLPLSEKIRMFRADFPDGTIECTVLCDNNVFATVEANIRCSLGGAKAVAKWYHNNQDVFGINYLGTAQSNAVSAALRMLGYDITTETDAPPQANTYSGEMELLPLLSTNEVYTAAPKAPANIKNGVVPDVKKTNKNISLKEAREISIYNPPFSGKTIGQIIDEDFYKPEFIKLMEYHYKHATELGSAARVVLEAIYNE